MSNPKQKRSLSIHAHQTSIALEAEFWAVLDAAIDQDGRSMAAFISAQDDVRSNKNSPHGLAAYLRLFALKWVQENC